MKKSELKKRILEALTPDEASKVDAKYKEIYAGMVGKNPLKMKKYDNPDKVAYGRAINLIQKESLKLAEKLGKKAKVGDYIEDFTDSDAPQFKGKSDKKKKQMAVAAFLNKEEQKLDEIDAMMEESAYEAGRLEKKVKAILKKEGGAVGLKPLVDAAKELGATKKDLMGILKKMKEVKTHKDGDIIDTGGLNETGRDIAKKNMDMYKDKNRLEELVKAALMGPMNEKKQRPDYPDIDGDGDTEEPMVKAAKDKEKAKGKIDEASKAGKLRIPKDIEKLLQDAHGDFMAGKIDGIGLGEKLDYILNNPGGPDEKTSGVQVTTVDMDLDESFDSLVKKVDKSKGYTKKEAEKVAGSIAAKKMKGAGKGPTAKQKKRMAETILKELRG